MTHPCRVPLHSISRKIINRAKSLAAELAGGLAAGSQVVLQEWVSVHMYVLCAYLCMLRYIKGLKTKIDSVNLHLLISFSRLSLLLFIYWDNWIRKKYNKVQNKRAPNASTPHILNFFHACFNTITCIFAVHFIPYSFTLFIILTLSPPHTHTVLWSVSPWWPYVVITQT